jgi:hypothetical protein
MRTGRSMPAPRRQCCAAARRLPPPGAALALALLAICAACREQEDEGWTVEGDAPPAFMDEVRAAADATFEVAGLTDRRGWRGTVHVHPEAFDCLRDVTCNGTLAGPFDVRVVYDEAHGLGPQLGTTALEHELCHAALLRAGVDSSAGGAAEACAGAVVGRIRDAQGR